MPATDCAAVGPATTLPAGLGARVRAGLATAARAVTSPLLPEDYLDLVAPLRSGAPLRGRIEAIAAETADAATITIRVGRGWAGHLPGQYVRVGVDVAGVRRWRAYSVTSGPRRDGRIAITVKVVPGGLVSTYLVREARPGTLLHLDQAAGDFHLPPEPPRRVLFLTAGSGITPAVGMLRHGLERLGDVVVVHSEPTAQGVIFAAQLRSWAAAGRIRLVERHTDRQGRLDLADLDRIVPDWPERHTWACGPLGLLDEAEARWAGAGVGARLHVERFRARVAAVGDGGAVTFARSGVSVRVDGATPLLDAGEGAGVLMRSGCRMGICFGCVTSLNRGAVRDLRTGAVTVADTGDGVKVQPCVSAAAGPCELDA